MASAVRVALLARGIGVSYSVSTGNEASLGAEDFLEEFIDDPHTRVIAMLMEQIRRPARFLELASRTREAGKFIVLHHLGRSAAGRDEFAGLGSELRLALRAAEVVSLSAMLKVVRRRLGDRHAADRVLQTVCRLWRRVTVVTRMSRMVVA